MSTTHTITEAQRHSRWDNSIPPAIEIEPGDRVVFETPDAINGQITPGSTGADLANLDFDVIHQINGPVAVKGALPGDTLVVKIESIVPNIWGWNAAIPGFGLLQEDDSFQEPFLQHWDLSSGLWAEMKPEIRVPFEPFCGIMGVAPKENGEFGTLPPRFNGGNVDTKQAQPGSTVYLPVLHPGANFSLGDVHAAQGDGEVCGTAIECQCTVTVIIDLMKGHPQPELAIFLPGAMPGNWNTKGWMVTTAHNEDLMAGARQALRYMIEYLKRSRGLSAAEAYCLCSACADLKISQIVDAPNWGVTCSFPMGVFVN